MPKQTDQDGTPKKGSKNPANPCSHCHWINFVFRVLQVPRDLSHSLARLGHFSPSWLSVAGLRSAMQGVPDSRRGVHISHFPKLLYLTGRWHKYFDRQLIRFKQLKHSVLCKFKPTAHCTHKHEINKHISTSFNSGSQSVSLTILSLSISIIDSSK